VPYRYANYWVAMTVVIVIWGFWGSYFNPEKTVPIAFHVHAISALAWLGLLMLQIWSINNQKRDWHKQLGKLSYLMFPIMILGFVMIVDYAAEQAMIPGNSRGEFLGPSFGFSMLVAIFAYLTVYYLALKHRRNIRLHAGYMLTTPLILFESPLARVLPDIVPLAKFTGSSYPQIILDSIAISMLLSALFGLILYFWLKQQGKPFLIAALFLIAESITMYFLPKFEWARNTFFTYAEIPTGITLVVGFFAGATIVYLGWKAGKSAKL